MTIRHHVGKGRVYASPKKQMYIKITMKDVIPQAEDIIELSLETQFQVRRSKATLTNFV